MLKDNLEKIKQLLKEYKFIKSISIFDKSAALTFEVEDYEKMEQLKREITEKIKGDYYEFGAVSKRWQCIMFGNKDNLNEKDLESRTERFIGEFIKL